MMPIGPGRSLRLAAALLVLDGLAGLYLGGLIGGAVCALAVLAVAASWPLAPRLARLAAARGAAAAVAAVAAAASLVDLLLLAESALDALARLLVFLVLYRLLTGHALRDMRDVAFLAFFMLVLVAPATSAVSFLFVLTAFLVIGIWALMLYHVQAEPLRAGAAGSAALTDTLGPDLLRLSAVASVATLALTLTLFFVLPRVGQATLPLRAHVGRLVSGFSDRVELGALGEIELDASVAMRVHLPDTADPERLPGLRWRGVVLDEFDGRVWSVGHPTRVTLGQMLAVPNAAYYQLGLPRGIGPVVTQEVFLEPLGTPAIFAAPRALRLRTAARSVVMDDMGSLSIGTPTARLSYVVQSEL
jgi:hypothetical protein